MNIIGRNDGTTNHQTQDSIEYLVFYIGDRTRDFRDGKPECNPLYHGCRQIVTDYVSRISTISNIVEYNSTPEVFFAEIFIFRLLRLIKYLHCMK